MNTSFFFLLFAVIVSLSKACLNDERHVSSVSNNSHGNTNVKDIFSGRNLDQAFEPGDAVESVQDTVEQAERALEDAVQDAVDATKEGLTFLDKYWKILVGVGVFVVFILPGLICCLCKKLFCSIFCPCC